MSSIKIDNADFEHVKQDTYQGLGYKLKKAGLKGGIVLSMLPFLAGCGKKEDFSNTQTTTSYKYFNEEDRKRDAIIIDMDMTNEALEELKEFGDQITKVYIEYAYNIDDLRALAEYCPNIQYLEISFSPSISDLSFIYSLPNLKQVDIKENGYVTPELVEYLDSKGIKHNITKEDLENVAELDRIIAEIITDDMTDEEKIQAITYYVVDNFKNDLLQSMDSNYNPLSSMLDKKRGVCAGYAYLTNILLRKAGVKSFEVATRDQTLGHAWNLIEIDGKYYYLDVTNVNLIPYISKLILEHYNNGLFYMRDPMAPGLSTMGDYRNAEKISIPPAMIEDIERGEDEKTLVEKYGSSCPEIIIKLIIIMMGITLGFKLTANGIEAVRESNSYKKIRKRVLERQSREALQRKEERAARRRAALEEIEKTKGRGSHH